MSIFGKPVEIKQEVILEGHENIRSMNKESILPDIRSSNSCSSNIEIKRFGIIS